MAGFNFREIMMNVTLIRALIDWLLLIDYRIFSLNGKISKQNLQD